MVSFGFDSFTENGFKKTETLTLFTAQEEPLATKIPEISIAK